MKRFIASEKLLIEEVTQSAKKAREATRALPIGSLIKLIRTQLGMSQKILSQLALVPQSTISRIEKGEKDANISTLNKLLRALHCNLVITPLLEEPVEQIRRKQAKKKAENRIRYLKGNMNLEKQQPDSRLLEELIKEEENRLLRGSGTELWES